MGSRGSSRAARSCPGLVGPSFPKNQLSKLPCEFAGCDVAMGQAQVSVQTGAVGRVGEGTPRFHDSGFHCSSLLLSSPI